jgi:hypothetical protein
MHVIPVRCRFHVFAKTPDNGFWNNNRNYRKEEVKVQRVMMRKWRCYLHQHPVAMKLGLSNQHETD